MTAPVRVEVDLPQLVLGLVEGYAVTPAWAPVELSAQIDALLVKRKDTDFPPPPLRKAVRDLLRAHGYKPTGRGKPASEYLARAVDRGAFPRINNLVDLCNLASLETGLPISLLDLDRARDRKPDTQLVLRSGTSGEAFVFNAAGHQIDVAGLPVVARERGEALANAVKDSMLSKIADDTQAVLVVVYGTRDVLDEAGMTDVCAGIARRLRTFAGAAETRVHVLVGSSA